MQEEHHPQVGTNPLCRNPANAPGRSGCFAPDGVGYSVVEPEARRANCAADEETEHDELGDEHDTTSSSDDDEKTVRTTARAGVRTNRNELHEPRVDAVPRSLAMADLQETKYGAAVQRRRGETASLVESERGSDMRANGVLYLCVSVACVMLAGSLGGCYKSSCTNAARAWCETCGSESDWDDDYCTCVQESGLTTSTAIQPFASDEDAGLWCDETLNELKYVGDDTAQECASEEDMLNKWGSDYCDDFYYY